jgi:segregation and condensation protein B
MGGDMSAIETENPAVRNVDRIKDVGEEQGNGSVETVHGDPRGFEERELMGILEALLFVSHEPVTVERLAGALGGPTKAQIREALGRLQTEYEASQRGLQLVELAGGFQLSTRTEHAPWIRQLAKTKPSPKLSRSSLEALAIIAYKQPIVRSEIEDIRGVETAGVLRTLLERKFVRIVGRKDVPGRPIMYATTRYFLQHFGLRDLAELPPLREFKELGESEPGLFPASDDALPGNGAPETESSL